MGPRRAMRCQRRIWIGSVEGRFTPSPLSNGMRWSLLMGGVSTIMPLLGSGYKGPRFLISAQEVGFI